MPLKGKKPLETSNNIKGFLKGLLVLAAPMMLQNLLTYAVNFADNVMVGSLGESAISGVYLGNQPFQLMSTIQLGINNGFLVMAAQYWGRKDTESIKRVLAIAMRYALGLSLLFMLPAAIKPEWILDIFSNEKEVIAEGVGYLKYTCFAYMFFSATQLLIRTMQGVEFVKVGMYTSMISLGTNVILNYILIFGKLGLPALGVKGAAIATLISRIAEFAVAAGYVFFVDKKLNMKFKNLFTGDRLLGRDYIVVALPIMLGQLLWGSKNAVQSAVLGNLGSTATSAISISGMSMQMLFVMFTAVSSAVGITTGKLVGAGEIEQVKVHAKRVQLLFLTLGLMFAAILVLLSDPISSLYNITDETVAVVRQFSYVLAFTTIGTCYQGHALGGLVRAGGDTKFVPINDTIFTFLIVIPSALIALYFSAPAWFVYFCLRSDEILKIPVAYFKINSFNWIKNITRDAKNPEANKSLV